jgi:hypothetical protein
MYWSQVPEVEAPPHFRINLKTASRLFGLHSLISQKQILEHFLHILIPQKTTSNAMFTTELLMPIFNKAYKEIGIVPFFLPYLARGTELHRVRHL